MLETIFPFPYVLPFLYICTLDRAHPTYISRYSPSCTALHTWSIHSSPSCFPFLLSSRPSLSLLLTLGVKSHNSSTLFFPLPPHYPSSHKTLPFLPPWHNLAPMRSRAFCFSPPSVSHHYAHHLHLLLATHLNILPEASETLPPLAGTLPEPHSTTFSTCHTFTPTSCLFCWPLHYFLCCYQARKLYALQQ
jgi:hypothetical protein